MLKKGLFLCSLVGLFFGILGLKNINVQASVEKNSFQKEELLNFITDNLDELELQYNRAIDKMEEKLDIDFVEGYTLVKILDNDTYGLYFDFNGNHGYMLSSFDFKIYDLKASGDLTYLKKIPFAYFHTADGFLFKTETGYGRYSNLEKNENEEKRIETGQFMDGESGIYDPDAYAAEQYKNYDKELTINGIWPNGYTGVNKSGLSYYRQYVLDGSSYFRGNCEGNCAQVAIFNMMNWWEYYNIVPNLPDLNQRKNVLANTANMPYYNEYGCGTGGNGISDYWSINQSAPLDNMYQLYSDIYDCTYRYTNYRPDSGTTYSESVKIVNETLALYGESLNLVQSDAFADVLPDLFNLITSFMFLEGSPSYGNHAVTLLGFIRFKHTTGWWIFEQTKTAYLYLIDDGLTGICYYDPNTTNITRRFIGSGIYN